MLITKKCLCEINSILSMCVHCYRSVAVHLTMQRVGSRYFENYIKLKQFF